MSRIRRFTHALFSGYLLIAATTLQTLLLVPMALHYLSKEEFGLWTVALQVSSYLLLIDLGMTNSICRILIDHKDDPGGGAYRGVLKIGAFVMAGQGAFIAIGGALLSLWLPALLGVPMDHRQDFQILMAGQCIVLGVLFAGRISDCALQAHQRTDLCSYALICGIALNLSVVWFGLAHGWRLYSLLAGSAAGQTLSTSFTFTCALRLKYFPRGETPGKAPVETFHEIFSYGRHMLLLYVGQQLVSASQVIIITRTMGLNAAAVWAIASKFFMLALQAVSRLLDFSVPALSEMIVRAERERLQRRFGDMVTLSASFGVWAGLSAALCNSSFVDIWTHGRIRWSGVNDWLMALQIMLAAITRCFVMLAVLAKDLRAMRYVYLAEGILFVALGFTLAPNYGFSGVIGAAILSNLLCSGAVGVRRARNYFGFHDNRNFLGWLRSPLICFVAQAVIFAGFWFLSAPWSRSLRFIACAGVATLAGFGAFWQLGLTPELRLRATEMLSRWRTAILRPFSARGAE